MKMKVAPRGHAALIGFDSDGCVFDSMGLKHRECFCPAFIGRFGLQAVSKAARETWEFVNLDSTTRGVNRFRAVLAALRLLKSHPDIAARGFTVPDLPGLEAWVAGSDSLSEPALERFIAGTRSDELPLVLAWSRDVNAAVAAVAKSVPPFPRVAGTLERASRVADLMVVSQTPAEAIEREWEANGLLEFIWIAAGQEFGSKAEQLNWGLSEMRGPALMVGDAPGDLAAAQEAGARFFPIIPGSETESWRLLADEVLDAWLAGRYGEREESDLLASFRAALPRTPAWIRTAAES